MFRELIIQLGNGDGAWNLAITLGLAFCFVRSVSILSSTSFCKERCNSKNIKFLLSATTQGGFGSTQGVLLKYQYQHESQQGCLFSPIPVCAQVDIFVLIQFMWGGSDLS